MSELGFRARRGERRRRLAQIGAGLLGIFMLGGVFGWVLHRPTFVPVTGAKPQSCITLAVFPNEFAPAPSEINVNVLNGSHRVGMAGITSDVLAERGFKIGKVGNFDPYKVETVAEVHFGPAGRDAALVVAAYVPGATLVPDSRTDASVDLVVGQLFKDVASQQVADVELSRPIASPSGPGC